MNKPIQLYDAFKQIPNTCYTPIYPHTQEYPNIPPHQIYPNIPHTQIYPNIPPHPVIPHIYPHTNVYPNNPPHPGISTNDGFIMLSVWRATNDRYSMETRMALTYREAGVSIVITAVIDIFTILIGVVSKIPAIRYFCIYTCFCVLFAFVYQVSAVSF